MNFIYFDGKHINRAKVHYIEKHKVIVNDEDVYRVYMYLDLIEVVDFFTESFQSEEEANERYYEILGHLNSN